MSTDLVSLSSTAPIIDRELARAPRLKSENTKRGYRHDLAQFEEWRKGRPMTKLLVEEYAAVLQQSGKSPNSINRTLASIRSWARRLGDLSFEDVTIGRDMRDEIVTQAARIASVKDVTGTRQQKGRHIEAGELSALMRACAADHSPAGIRDAAIIALAWSTGMRRSEIADLSLSSVHWTSEDEAEITIHHGKGDKTRPAYIFNGAALALRDWLAIRGNDDGPLFYPIHKAGEIIRAAYKVGMKGHKGESFEVEPRVTDEALAQMLAKRAAQAELSQPITWHDFRRTFAGNLLDANTDLVTVQKLLGHASPTTSPYDRRPDEVKRRAVRSLHVPYKARKLDA